MCDCVLTENILTKNNTVCPVCPVTSFCEPISRVLEKIERIHNMPRKAEHLSFQGKKRFWKSEHGLRSYFIFCAAIPILCIISPILCIISRFCANISGSRKDREDTQHASESWTSQLSREKKILKIGAWVTELFHLLCSYSDFVRAGNFKKGKNWRCKFAHNSLVSEPIFKIFFSSESCHAKLLEEKRTFEISSVTWELWLKNVSAWTKSKQLHKK